MKFDCIKSGNLNLQSILPIPWLELIRSTNRALNKRSVPTVQGRALWTDVSSHRFPPRQIRLFVRLFVRAPQVAIEIILPPSPWANCERIPFRLCITSFHGLWDFLYPCFPPSRAKHFFCLCALRIRATHGGIPLELSINCRWGDGYQTRHSPKREVRMALSTLVESHHFLI